jgi:hypothetical protein
VQGARLADEVLHRTMAIQHGATVVRLGNTTVIQSAPKIERTAVSVSVGVAIPTHVRLAPLPSAIVVDVPSDCQLMYFVWGSDVVIVDDCSRRVVEIIVNVA